VIEVTNQPHTGCKKFVERFGLDAVNFVNSAVGRELHLRGINARVVQPGTIRVGDVVRKLSAVPLPSEPGQPREFPEIS
jgi:MOSC domain-containing protein YiiM